MGGECRFITVYIIETGLSEYLWQKTGATVIITLASASIVKTLQSNALCMTSTTEPAHEEHYYVTSSRKKKKSGILLFLLSTRL